MRVDERPVREQLTELERVVQLNPVVDELLRRMEDLPLPDCWLAAGALFQTVWNVLSDRDPQAGILDYTSTTPTSSTSAGMPDAGDLTRCGSLFAVDA